MPFTLSHAAAVLPFRRTRLPWSALVIGSFGPDFEYFLRMNYGSRAWHFYPDVLIYCLPFSVLVYFAFQLFVRRPLIELLPRSFQARIGPAPDAMPRSFASVFWLMTALVLGVLTHLLWDSLTHASSWPWAHVSLLRQDFILPNGGRAYGFVIAQAASTVLGIVLLAVAVWRWYRDTSPHQPPSRCLSSDTKIATLAGMALLAIVGAFWRAIHVMGPHHTMHLGSLARLLLVIAGIGCLLWELLTYGVIITLWRKSKEAHR
jgi:hypothetical protein